MRSQKRHTGRKASFVVIVTSSSSNCCNTGSGCLVAKVSLEEVRQEYYLQLLLPKSCYKISCPYPTELVQ